VDRDAEGQRSTSVTALGGAPYRLRRPNQVDVPAGFHAIKARFKLPMAVFDQPAKVPNKIRSCGDHVRSNDSPLSFSNLIRHIVAYAWSAASPVRSSKMGAEKLTRQTVSRARPVQRARPGSGSVRIMQSLRWNPCLGRAPADEDGLSLSLRQGRDVAEGIGATRR